MAGLDPATQLTDRKLIFIWIVASRAAMTRNISALARVHDSYL